MNTMCLALDNTFLELFIILYWVIKGFLFFHRSIARTDLDISYITSRIIVMPYPSEGLESAYKTNHIDDVRVRTTLYIPFFHLTLAFNIPL